MAPPKVCARYSVMPFVDGLKNASPWMNSDRSAGAEFPL
jgi:hypothetical protein